MHQQPPAACLAPCCGSSRASKTKPLSAAAHNVKLLAYRPSQPPQQQDSGLARSSQGVHACVCLTSPADTCWRAAAERRHACELAGQLGPFVCSIKVVSVTALKHKACKRLTFSEPAWSPSGTWEPARAACMWGILCCCTGWCFRTGGGLFTCCCRPLRLTGIGKAWESPPVQK